MYIFFGFILIVNIWLNFFLMLANMYLTYDVTYTSNVGNEYLKKTNIYVYVTLTQVVCNIHISSNIKITFKFNVNDLEIKKVQKQQFIHKKNIYICLQTNIYTKIIC